MKKYIIISLVAIVLIFNFTPLAYLLKENYTYSNYDGSYQFGEEGGEGSDFHMAKTRYQWFLAKHQDKARKDSALYRTFTIKPWRFWQWSDWLFCPERFRLPYRQPEISI